MVFMTTAEGAMPTPLSPDLLEKSGRPAQAVATEQTEKLLRPMAGEEEPDNQTQHQ